MTRIKDVAELANVSTATVSRILNNDPSLSVSGETRQRVLDVASELNYVHGKRKKPKSAPDKEIIRVGLVLTNDEAVDPYFMSIRRGVESVCDQYAVKIESVFYTGRSRFTASAMEGLDGLIVLGDVNSEELRSLFGNDHIIFADYQPAEEGFDVVITDFESATRRMMDTLLEAGHTVIAYIGGERLIQSIHAGNGHLMPKEETRVRTYEQVMRDKGLFDPELVLLGDFSPMSGYQLMKQLIDQGSSPTAVVMASDPMAIGAMKALQEAGIRVPDDMAMFSFDDIDSAAFLNPPLSTVKVHTEEMGRTAVKLLVDRLRNGRTLPMKVILPSELMIRESAGRVYNKGGQ
ncbi:HTH-type transcriptional repressor PurR [compost metagenome]